MSKRGLDRVTATMQQDERRPPGIRRPVNFVVHPKAVDRRVTSPNGSSGVHRTGGEQPHRDESDESFHVGRVGLGQLRVCELRICADISEIRGNETFASNGSHFDTNTIRQTGTFPGNGNRFIHRGYVEKEITANSSLDSANGPSDTT